MPIAFGDTPITSVSRGANAIASATLERLGFPGQTASVFSAVSPPDAPTNVAITTGDGTIDLSWTAPASEVAITDYRVEYTPSGGSATEVLVGSDATSYQLTGLTNDTEYSVRVAAISAGGQGDYSAAVTGTPANVALTTTASGFTGTGTSSDKLRAVDTTEYAVPVSISFVAGVSGTFNISASRATSPDEENLYVNGSFWRKASWSGFTYVYSVNVLAGDTVTLSVEKSRTASFDNLQAWIE